MAEIDSAEKTLLKLVQQESFTGPTDRRLRSLLMFQDHQGILHVRTPVSLREDTEDFRYPIILPNDHLIVRRLVHWTHYQMYHAGVQTVFTKLRERFWILKGRQLIKKVIRQCGRCQRHDSQKQTTVPCPLPTERVQDAAVFQTTGVDLAGPVYLKGGQKAWIVLFTCAVYRAVHLELAPSLSTDDFLSALRRFIARRGRPQTLWSDNGTNFVGADNAFGRLNWDDICESSTTTRITWKFNPPTAAWWGGWWERLVGMLKQILRRVLGRACLNYEDMVTILCDCESVLNNRPLTHVSQENGDLSPLTPALFLGELPVSGLPEAEVLDHNSLNKRLRHRQQVRVHLRKRFRQEYLATLGYRGTSELAKVPLAVGDVVLIGREDSKRLDWPLARVTETFPGKDGHIRVCRVKTASGELLRPIQRLFPLEVRNQDTFKTCQLSPGPTVVHENLEEKPTPASRVLTRSGRVSKPPDRLNIC